MGEKDAKHCVEVLSGFDGVVTPDRVLGACVGSPELLGRVEHDSAPSCIYRKNPEMGKSPPLGEFPKRKDFVDTQLEGYQVVIGGLQSERSLNGKRGSFQELLANGRLAVALGGRTIQVKASNLTMFLGGEIEVWKGVSVELGMGLDLLEDCWMGGKKVIQLVAGELVEAEKATRREMALLMAKEEEEQKVVMRLEETLMWGDNRFTEMRAVSLNAKGEPFFTTRRVTIAALSMFNYWKDAINKLCFKFSANKTEEYLVSLYEIGKTLVSLEGVFREHKIWDEIRFADRLRQDVIAVIELTILRERTNARNIFTFRLRGMKTRGEESLDNHVIDCAFARVFCRRTVSAGRLAKLRVLEFIIRQVEEGACSAKFDLAVTINGAIVPLGMGLYASFREALIMEPPVMADIPSKGEDLDQQITGCFSVQELAANVDSALPATRLEIVPVVPIERAGPSAEITLPRPPLIPRMTSEDLSVLKTIAERIKIVRFSAAISPVLIDTKHPENWRWPLERKCICLSEDERGHGFRSCSIKCADWRGEGRLCACRLMGGGSCVEQCFCMDCSLCNGTRIAFKQEMGRRFRQLRTEVTQCVDPVRGREAGVTLTCSRRELDRVIWSEKPYVDCFLEQVPPPGSVALVSDGTRTIAFVVGNTARSSRHGDLASVDIEDGWFKVILCSENWSPDKNGGFCAHELRGDGCGYGSDEDPRESDFLRYKAKVRKKL